MHRQCLPPHEIEARLRARSIQPTAQRITICQYVLCEADHPTADQVKRWVDDHFPKISLATVYNTLNTLVEAGLLRELRLADRDCAVYDSNVDLHYHFVDEATGRIYDLAPETVTVQPRLGEAFAIHQVDVVFRGAARPTES